MQLAARRGGPIAMRRIVSRLFAIRLSFAAAVLALATVRPALGQNVTSPELPDTEVCLGFSFGPWAPTLDWRLAGHGEVVDSTRVERAPGGRAWAAPSAQSPSDTALMLFPTWWPVGVIVELTKKAPAPGDTVTGRATALIADGRQHAPTSRVKAWRVACRQ
jgi:hypothetical protein